MVSIEEQIKYIYNLKYICVDSLENYYKINKNIKSLMLAVKININKLPNTLIKLHYYFDNYLNNLPLNLKYLLCKISNCNLPPNIIYLFYNYDSYNLPRNLQFIYINNKNKISKVLIDHNYNKHSSIFLSFKKLKSIY